MPPSSSKESRQPAMNNYGCMDFSSCCYGVYRFFPTFTFNTRESTSKGKIKLQDRATTNEPKSRQKAEPAPQELTKGSSMKSRVAKVHSEPCLVAISEPSTRANKESPPSALTLQPAETVSVQAAHVDAQVPSRYVAERKDQSQADVPSSTPLSISSSPTSYIGEPSPAEASRSPYSPSGRPWEAATVSASSSSDSPNSKPYGEGSLGSYSYPQTLLEPEQNASSSSDSKPIGSVTWDVVETPRGEEVPSNNVSPNYQVDTFSPREFEGCLTPRSTASYHGSEIGTEQEEPSPRRDPPEDRDALAASLGGASYIPWELTTEPVAPANKEIGLRPAGPIRTPRTPRTPGREGEFMTGEGWETCSTSIGGDDELMERYYDLGPREPGLQPANHADLLTTLLPDTIQAHDDETLKDYLRRGADPNNTSVGDLPLMLAINTGRLSAVQALLDAKADVNQQDASGNVVLVEAVYLQDTDIIQALIAAGADTELEDCDGTKASDMICFGESP